MAPVRYRTISSTKNRVTFVTGRGPSRFKRRDHVDTGQGPVFDDSEYLFHAMRCPDCAALEESSDLDCITFVTWGIFAPSVTVRRLDEKGNNGPNTGIGSLQVSRITPASEVRTVRLGQTGPLALVMSIFYLARAIESRYCTGLFVCGRDHAACAVHSM